MAKMSHDDFEAWIRERASGCMEQSKVDEMCKGDLDFDSGEYTFRDQSVQAQWESWQAAYRSFRAMTDPRDEPKPVEQNSASLPCSPSFWAEKFRQCGHPLDRILNEIRRKREQASDSDIRSGNSTDMEAGPIQVNAGRENVS